MAANSVIRVASLDFSSIKSSLRDYMASQTQFNDYDFESSTLSLLLDVLAYNTRHMGYYLNMVANESFLDSAQLRNSVVSHAKKLGYIPRSFQGASATLQVTITPDDSPTNVTIAKNSAFTTTIDGETYKFVTPRSYVLSSNSATFSANIEVVQGEPLTHDYTVSTVSPVRYIIPNRQVDTRSLSVVVQESSSNSTQTAWNKANDLSNLTANSKVWFLQENEDEKYELYFGDGTIGKNLRDGNIVKVSYRITDGSRTNGANTFSGATTLGGYSNYTHSTISAASGGANNESIASIKYNAPGGYEAQNRLVTVEDYKNAVLTENGDIQAIAVWGGEDNSPPKYGEVYISVKPFGSAIISDQKKASIKASLKTRNIMSIDPVFVDATYLYIVPEITARYNPNVTSLDADAIITKIKNTLIEYETDTLGVFSTKFFYSKFLKAIDASDTSIIGVLANIRMQKRFVPVTNASTAYTLSFNNAIYNPYSGYIYAISSTAFTYQNKTCYFDDDGQGNLRIYYKQGSSRVYVNSSAGSVDYAAGLITMDHLLITGNVGDEIKVDAIPAKSDIFSVRNQILLVTDSTISLTNDATDVVDASLSTVMTEGSTAALLQNQTSGIVF